jgi:predicted AlkP superfamily phosphohydrolase/phosphomutase
MPFEAIAGFVYLNQIGREPFGIVPEADVQAVTAELRQALAAQRSPFTGKPLFDAVQRADEVYPVRGPFAFPDIFVLPAQGVNLVRKLSFGDAVEIPPVLHRGTHRSHGIFALKGAGVLAGRQDERASLADIAPTILALTGTAIPDDMTGRVLNEFFDPPLAATKTSAEQMSGGAFGANVYSEAESKAVEQRLADLGYVD